MVDDYASLILFFFSFIIFWVLLVGTRYFSISEFTTNIISFIGKITILGLLIYQIPFYGFGIDQIFQLLLVLNNLAFLVGLLVMIILQFNSPQIIFNKSPTSKIPEPLIVQNEEKSKSNVQSIQNEEQKLPQMTISIFQHPQNEILPKSILEIASKELYTVYNQDQSEIKEKKTEAQIVQIIDQKNSQRTFGLLLPVSKESIFKQLKIPMGQTLIVDKGRFLAKESDDNLLSNLQFFNNLIRLFYRFSRKQTKLISVEYEKISEWIQKYDREGISMKFHWEDIDEKVIQEIEQDDKIENEFQASEKMPLLNQNVDVRYTIAKDIFLQFSLCNLNYHLVYGRFYCSKYRYLKICMCNWMDANID